MLIYHNKRIRLSPKAYELHSHVFLTFFSHSLWYKLRVLSCVNGPEYNQKRVGYPHSTDTIIEKVDLPRQVIL